MYLLDTNVIIEILLQQSKAEEAKRFLDAAEKNNLTLVSFDTDFDGTERGRKTPAELLKP